MDVSSVAFKALSMNEVTSVSTDRDKKWSEDGLGLPCLEEREETVGGRAGGKPGGVGLGGLDIRHFRVSGALERLVKRGLRAECWTWQCRGHRRREVSTTAR